MPACPNVACMKGLLTNNHVSIINSLLKQRTMKTKMISFIALWMMGTVTLFAIGEDADIKEKFKVAGNCGMCETRIEKAAKGVEGVNAADWDKETKMIEVTFNPEVTGKDQIQLAIAEVGHDTPLHRAGDEVYEKLPGCCKYERMKYSE
jgi:copper chaperone CopZ